MDKFTPFTSSISFSQLSISVPDAMMIALGVFILLRVFCFRRMKFSRTLLCGAFAVYIGAVAALTLFPVFPGHFAFSWQNFANEFHQSNLSPFFWSIQMFQNGMAAGNMGTVFYNLGGNLIMLMPFGILVPLIWRTSPPKTILLAVVSAFGIEFIQFLENVFHIGYNDVSFDDFFLNALGCILAYLLFLGIRTALRKS
jgi:glycopeptide antibiotics resistance protein